MAATFGKRINVDKVKGLEGAQSRNFSNERIYSTGWRARVATLAGIQQTYPWIAEQVRKQRARKKSV